MQRIVFLNRFYWPDIPATGQLLTDLARALAGAGRPVLVITSRPPNAARQENDLGVDIVRVRSSRGGSGRLLRKAVDFGSFFIGALWRAFRVLRKGDVLVVMTDPPLLGPFAGWIARARGARVIHWIQDIYPEVAIEITGHRWLGAVRPIRDHAWRSADIVVTLGSDMAAVVAGAGVPLDQIAIVPNWAPDGLRPLAPDDEDVRDLRRTWGLDDRFIVVYSGNLGRVHDLDPVLRAAALLRNEPRIAFLFIGGGAQRSALEAGARREQLTNVRFVDPQPRAQLGPALAAGDVHLVTLKPGCERYVYPSKLYGIAGVGRPVVFVGPEDCGLSQLVREAGLGRSVDRNAPASLAEALRELASNPAELAKCRLASAAFGRTARSESAAVAWNAILDKLRDCG